MNVPPSSRRTNPNLDHLDSPEAISVADFAAHLEAHRQLAETLRSSRSSDPVTIRRGSLSVSGRGIYLIGMGILALVGEVVWLLLR